MGRRYVVTFGSELMDHKSVRRRVRQLLRKLVEPEPKYRTGKFWTD